MQIITGKLKGRKLKSVPGDTTRPTLGRVKESIFDLISEYISGKNVLDLFAGTGALGIESLSRGATGVTFVDKEPKAIVTIKQNLKNDLSGTKIINQDYLDAIFTLEKSGAKFDLVLLDPPFESDYLENCLYLLHKHNLLNDGAIIMCEKSSKKLLQNYPQKYIIVKCRSYGTISTTIFRYNKES